LYSKRRKEERSIKKAPKVLIRKNMAKADEAAVATAKSDKPRTGGVLKRPDQTKAVKTKAPKQVKYSSSAMQDPEDMEIARLEKLLGVSKKGQLSPLFQAHNIFTGVVQIKRRAPRNSMTSSRCMR
jgi:hypothetical protein